MQIERGLWLCKQLVKRSKSITLVNHSELDTHNINFEIKFDRLIPNTGTKSSIMFRDDGKDIFQNCC